MTAELTFDNADFSDAILARSMADRTRLHRRTRIFDDALLEHSFDSGLSEVLPGQE